MTRIIHVEITETPFLIYHIGKGQEVLVHIVLAMTLLRAGL